MSIYKMKMSNGKRSPHYYYEFTYKGKRYKGSTGTSDKKEAENYQEEFKNQLKANIKTNVNIADRSLLAFRENVTRNIKGEPIHLNKIWAIFRQRIPSFVKRQPSEAKWKIKEGYWNDFKSFAESKKLVSIDQITKSHCRDYVTHLKTKGKFNKTISNGKKGSYTSKIKALAGSTVNEYISQLRQIFRVMEEPAGLLLNPFDNVVGASAEKRTRDVFEISELKAIDQFIKNGCILENSENPKLDREIIEAVFIIGVNTGLRRGDIASLTWSDVDMDNCLIRKELSKTKVKVEIPFTEQLLRFFSAREFDSAKNKYVVPSLAEMYNSNADGISYRFKKMLKQLGIESRVNHKERTRGISSKDIHSLRHTFCYLHGIQGTKETVLMSMTGHLTKSMADSYRLHITKREKQEAIDTMSSIALLSMGNTTSKKLEAKQLIEACYDEGTLDKVIQLLEGVSRDKGLAKH